MKKFHKIKSFILSLLVAPTLILADTPPQVINKLCTANQFFSQIQPGPGNIQCTQPTYSGISNIPAFEDSLSYVSNMVTLVNDSASPGNSQYYGTNSSGVKGFFPSTSLGGFISGLSGDGIATGPGNVPFTLTTVNSQPGVYGDSSHSAVLQINGKGLVTASSQLSILIAESQVTNLMSDLAGKQPVGNYLTALNGDGSAAGPGSSVLTLATVNSNVGSFGSSTAIPTFTVNGKGLVTAASSNAVIAPAGTLSGTTLNSTVVTSSLTSLGVQSAPLNMGTQQIINVVDPTTAQMAATKNYVDTAVAALQPIESVFAATTGSNIAGVYNNGVAGVGATFTTTATTTFTVDGVTPALNSRILIKDQSSGFQNGIYSFTTLPVNGVSGAVFTRTFDYDTAGDMNAAGLIPVLNGTLNALSSWQQVAVITTVGTDALVFTEFTANPSLYLLKANNLSDVANKVTAFNNISPMTSSGDLIYGGASGSGTRLPIGSNGQYLNISSGIPSWGPVVAPAGTLTGTTLASNVVNSSLTSVGTISTGVWQGTPVGIAFGGTNNSSAYTAGSIIFSNGTSLTQNNANLFWDNTNFALGIGTAPATTAVLDIVNNSGSTKAIQATGYGSNVGVRGRFANGTLASPTAATAGNILEFVSGRGYGTSSFATTSTGAINIIADGTFTNASMPTYLQFEVTATNSITIAEVMRLSSGGNLLIGTTTDSGTQKLQVNGNSNVGTVTAGTWTGTTIAIANGGTGVTSVTSVPTSQTWAGWGTNKHFSANNFIPAYTTTATAAGTTTLSVGSSEQQYFTGSTTQTVTLPVSSTMLLGSRFYFINNSTGVVTVQSSGGNTVFAMAAGSWMWVTSILITGTTAASWNYEYGLQGGGGGGSGVTTIGTIDSNGASANGASISVPNLYMQSASASNPGLVNNTAQTFSGAKLFNNQLQIGAAGTDTGASVLLGNVSTGNANERALSLQFTGDSSSTGSIRGIQINLSSAATAFISAQAIGVNIGTISAGAGSSITRAVSYFSSTQTVGTSGNATLSDNLSFSGNFFINQSGITPSVFGGPIEFTGSSSGVVTMSASSGTYNFNLPTNAGSSGAPLLSGGGSSTPMSYGSLSGNTSTFGTTSGTLTNGDCVKIDASGNLIDAGAACGGGSIALTNTHIFVGNGSNIATDVAASGDLTLVNTGAFTLNTVNSNVGSFGSSTAIPNFTVNAKGLITAVGSSAVVAPAGTLSGTTLNSTVVSSSLTSVGTITTGVWNGIAIADANLAVSYLKADGSRTLTGALVQTQQVTPSSPTTGSDAVYFKSDDNLYILNHAGVETKLATSSGVTGPGSTTNNAIATWNGTGGTAIQNSTVTIASGIVAGASLSGSSNTFTNIPDGALSTSYIKADGTRALTGSWNAGAFQITANSVQVGSAANTISQLSTIVNTGTLTLPTSSDTLVARATTDTLTNKTISGSSNTLSNIADGSLSTSYLKADGTRGLSGNWSAGAFTVGFGGTTTTIAVVNVASANPLTTTNQSGVNVGLVGTSAATSSIRGFNVTISSAASAFTSTWAASYAASPIGLGAGSTITNAITFLANGTETNGTNNATLADSSSFTGGSFFINQSGTNPSSFAGMMQEGGGVSYTSTRTVTTTATVGAHDTVVYCNQSAAFNLTLPAATDGRVIIIKDISGTATTNVVTVLRAGSDVIDGGTSVSINVNYMSITLVGKSGRWSII